MASLSNATSAVSLALSLVGVGGQAAPKDHTLPSGFRLRPVFQPSPPSQGLVVGPIAGVAGDDREVVGDHKQVYDKVLILMGSDTDVWFPTENAGYVIASKQPNGDLYINGRLPGEPNRSHYVTMNRAGTITYTSTSEYTNSGGILRGTDDLFNTGTFNTGTSYLLNIVQTQQPLRTTPNDYTRLSEINKQFGKKPCKLSTANGEFQIIRLSNNSLQVTWKLGDETQFVINRTGQVTSASEYRSSGVRKLSNSNAKRVADIVGENFKNMPLQKKTQAVINFCINLLVT